MKAFFKRLFGREPRAVFAPLRRNAGLTLPAWARVAPRHSPKVALCIDADTAEYVREWFDLLGVTQPDQYWLEVAYQCAKLDLQAALVGTEYDVRISKKPVEFHFSKAPQWAQVNFPKGRGTEAASKGREARAHYQKVRGTLPM